MPGPLEKDTCRDIVLPAVRASGWADEQIRAEFPVRARKVLSLGDASRQSDDGRVDYVLEIRPGLPVATIEAKRAYRRAADGVGQARRYGRQLDVPVTYATNGSELIEIDLARGTERVVEAYRTPAALWSDYCEWIRLDPQDARLLQQPFNRRKRTANLEVAAPRWYQQVAVNRVLTRIALGDKRLLLLMATGTGKTFTAMQIVHKLRSYNALVHPQGNFRVLYLADRDALIAQPMGKDFSIAFGQEPLARVSAGNDGKARDIVFATYQSLSADETALLSYSPTFFDLVIVDECHRGSADENSLWRGILDHFGPAVQLGLTATPKHEETIDTYRYFGDPAFSYSLREGIEDGYLAPYRVRRVVLDVDADGWEAAPGQVDVNGELVHEGVYTLRDFERRLVLLRRTEVVARYLVERLRSERRRMIVFCVDQEHAHRMRAALVNAAPDWSREDPEWVVRITGADDDKARLIKALCNPETDSPLVATTSRLLATGIDVEDLGYVVIFRPVGSQVEFKQIVGRGTRLYPEKAKTSFEVVDIVGASKHFADPDFDGYPTVTVVDIIAGDGERSGGTVVDPPDGEDPGQAPPPDPDVSEPAPGFTLENPTDPPGPGTDDGGEGSEGSPPRHKTVIADADVGLLAESLLIPDTSSGRLVLTEYGDYVAGQVRRIAGTPGDLARRWARKPDREAVLAALVTAGIDVELLQGRDAEAVDPFDLLVKIAWDQPVRTRAERARRVREQHFAEIEARSTAARRVIEALLARYESSGIDDATSAEALNLPPLSELGSRRQILGELGPEGWQGTIAELQEWIYSTPTAV